MKVSLLLRESAGYIDEEIFCEIIETNIFVAHFNY